MSDLTKNLEEAFMRWDYLYTYGGSDPFWSDGCNLSLVRNHIIIAKRKLEVLGQYPEIYYRELPPEVPRDYMARADEIRENAKKSLEIYKANNNYIYLCKAIKNLDKKQVNETCINNVIGYVYGLEMYIKEDDLIGMRRHEDANRYVESFARCRKKVELILGSNREKPKFLESKNQLEGQINLFDFIGA